MRKTKSSLASPPDVVNPPHAKFLPHELPDVELPAALPHVCGAGVAQVRVVRPEEEAGRCLGAAG
jgi:hypothetical protein